MSALPGNALCAGTQLQGKPGRPARPAGHPVDQPRRGVGRLLERPARAGFITRGESRQLKGLEPFCAIPHPPASLTGRREDRLLFDHQEAIARQFGMRPANAARIRSAHAALLPGGKVITQLNTILLQNLGRHLPEPNKAPIVINERFQMEPRTARRARRRRCSNARPAPSWKASCSWRSAPN
jgi:UTP:GlnB (protein PII) uridylyltransferase